MDSYEGNYEVYCPLTVIDPDKTVAKQKLMGMVRVLEDGFYINLRGYEFNNIKPDKTDQWLVIESAADETLIS